MVNTFILSDSPKSCVKLLDRQRLGKQRLEAKQIISAIETGKGWVNHPIVKMWKDNVEGLKYYFNCCVDEWVGRGYKNSMEKYSLASEDEKEILPWFYFNKQVQESMKASLLRKAPDHYKTVLSLEDLEYLKHGYIWANKLSSENIDKMKIGVRVNLGVICEPFGAGVPPQYRISKDVCETWNKNKLVNPKTGRAIKPAGAIYKDYEKAALFWA